MTDVNAHFFQRKQLKCQIVHQTKANMQFCPSANFLFIQFLSQNNLKIHIQSIMDLQLVILKSVTAFVTVTFYAVRNASVGDIKIGISCANAICFGETPNRSRIVKVCLNKVIIPSIKQAYCNTSNESFFFTICKNIKKDLTTSEPSLKSHT